MNTTGVRPVVLLILVTVAALADLVAGCGGNDETSEEDAAHERFCADMVNTLNWPLDPFQRRTDSR